jgi:hypothetical protein
MARTFFSSSIQELEALFKEQNDGLELLQALQEELTHRKTERATRLRTQVTERLAALRSGTSSREQTSQELPLFPPHQHQSASRSHEEQPSRHSQPLPVEAPATDESPRTKARTAPPPPLPPITNQPEDILSAWTALEVLSPPAYVRPEDLAGGDRTRVAKLNESSLPWERGERSRPNYRLYYQVALGSIKMEPTVERLIERYGDTRPEKPSVRGKAVLAVVVVDRQGRLVESPAVGISSFGWGVITALNGELADSARWPDVEPQLVERIEKLLLGVATGDEGEEEHRNRPLTRVALFAAYDALVYQLGLSREWVEPPELAIRSYVYYRDPNPPEPLLLNSFFLTDLALARRLFAECRRYRKVTQG